MRVLLFSLMGLVVGVGLGVLLAPEAGNETRRKLRYSADALKKKLRIDGDDFTDSEMEMDATNGRGFGY